jgi:hypothetical protein
LEPCRPLEEEDAISAQAGPWTGLQQDRAIRSASASADQRLAGLFLPTLLTKQGSTVLR